jgi:hypothetical protein
VPHEFLLQNVQLESIASFLSTGAAYLLLQKHCARQESFVWLAAKHLETAQLGTLVQKPIPKFLALLVIGVQWILQRCLRLQIAPLAQYVKLRQLQFKSPVAFCKHLQ